MKNELYRQYANYYAAITDDRNFKEEIDRIHFLYNENHKLKTLLELFAGQAKHSIIANKFFDIDVWAIDSSEYMKELAFEGGFKITEQYVVDYLPAALLNIHTKFDCITCLFNGLSNLDIQSVYELLKVTKNMLTDYGRIIVELHNIRMMMDYISYPLIHTVDVKTENGKAIKYEWPSDKIVWSDKCFKATVPIKVLDDSNAPTEFLFNTIDYIYSADEIIFLANLLGYKTETLNDSNEWKSTYPNSIVLQLYL